MSKAKKRFIVTYKESAKREQKQILVDKETGVNYLIYSAGYALSITPLLDSDGKPIITKL